MNAIASKMKSIAVIAMMLLSIGVGNVWGDKLCQSSYTGTIGALGSKTVYVSVGTIGTNMYRVVFEADFAMTGVDTYITKSGDSNFPLNSASRTFLDGGKIIYFDISSTEAPTFKNNFYVQYGGGAYGMSGTAVNSVDWSQTVAECSTLAGECTYTTNELILKVTTDGMTSTFELSHSSSDIIAVNNVNPVNLNSGSTSDLTNTGWTISDGKATKSITWSTLPTNNIITRVDIYANITGPSEKGGTFNSVDISCASSEEESSSEGNFNCSGHTFYFANNQWKFASPYAHMYNASGSPTTTWPGSAMSEVSGAAGIYSVTYDNDAYNKVIFSNNGSNQLDTKDIDDCTYYDYQGTSHENLSDVARHIYFVRNGSATSWNPHAYLWYSSSNCGNSGKALTDMSLTNIDEHNLYSLIMPIYNNIKFFKGSNDWSNESAGTYVSNTFQDYSIFNYEHNTWYQTQNIYLTGSMNSWATSNSNYKFSDWDQASTYVTLLTPALSASTTYDFKVITGGVARGLNSDNTYNANNQTKRLYEGGASEANVHLTTDVAGKYLFRYDVSACKLTIFFPPSMTSATLYSKTHNSATLTVASTRGTKYKVTNSDGSVEYTVSNGGVADGSGNITVTGLTPGTQYSFKVYALDDNDTESANYSSVSAFYTLPVMGTATLNTRTYNSITLEVTGTGASQYRVVNTSPAVDQTITPSDGKITVTSLSPNTSYTFTVTAKNAGGDASDNSVVMSAIYTTPQMTTATLDSKTQTTVVLNVASTGGSTYKVTNTAGNEYTLSSSTPTNGKITVAGLSANTEYTFRVYAISSSSSLVSSNYIDVTTSTYPNVNSGPSGYYDCQVQAIHTSGDEYSPLGMRLANWDYAAGGTPYTDGSSKNAYKVNTNSVSYAGLYFGNTWTGTPTTLCDASSCTKLHVEFWSAEAQSFDFNVIAYYDSKNNDGTPQSVTTTAGSWKVMDFTITDFGTTVSDHKDVISAFKIDYGSGNTGKELIIANAYFYTPDVCESMKCHGSGSAGSGLTINTAEVFDTGESYWTKTYMYNSKLHIDAKFTSGSSVYAAAAYVQFVKLDGGILQFGPMTNNTDSFSIEVTPSDVTDACRYDGIARYSVKFELSVSPKIRQTDYHYYDFTNSECAPDYFDIYHYDDATGSQRTSYAGGTILQPIRYFRHFEHTDWCAITFPFSVSKVVVDEGGTEYDLYPRFNNGSSDVEGYYWLKTFDNWNSTPVAISEFQSAWKQLTVSTASSDEAELAGLVKPAKDVPYVIAFPDGSYYGTYWVIFYGDAGQTIDSSEDGDCGTSFSGEGETVKLQRNNMMQPTSSKTNIYMLEEGHNYYSRQTQAIPAFESYVIGTATVKEKYRVLRMDNVSTPETPTDIDALPTTECRGAIYSLSGMRIATFVDRDAMEQLLSGLSAGVYVVRAGAVINKVVVQ